MTSEEGDLLVAKIEDLKPGEMVIFSRQEAEDLQEMALWWRRFKGAFAIGGVVGSAFKWFLLFGAFIAAARAGMLDWLGIGVGKP